MKHFLILIIAIVYFNPVVGQTPVVEWKKNISTGHPKIIIQTNENGFASLTHFDNVITLTKIDENGDLLWNYKIENLINNPEQLLNRFTNSLANGNSINHLNLNKIFMYSHNL